MKRLVLDFLVLSCLFDLQMVSVQAQQSSTPTTAADQYYPAIHTLGAWGTTETPSEKLAMYIGFVNGLFTHRGGADFGDLMQCMQGVRYQQAIAMIDKYYKDNPQRWSKPLAEEILIALTVKDGPCPGLNPWK
jgi:hypothetical protein